MSPNKLATVGGVDPPHQPDESVFRAMLSEEIEWKPFAAFPSQARLAVLVGEPTKAGPYVIRVKVPRGVKLMPHRHPEEEIMICLNNDNMQNRDVIAQFASIGKFTD